MVVLRWLAAVLISSAAGLLLAAGSARTDDGAGAPEITTIPVLTAGTDVGQSLTVCMYHGARPEPFRVVSSSCRGGAGQCTAFVALRSADDQVLLAGFDLLNPPVEATGPTCDRPLFLPSAVHNALPGQPGGSADRP